MIHQTLHFPISKQLTKNRVALAPMTNQQSLADGRLSEAEKNWLLMRAEGGFGMLITAGAYVHESGKGWPGQIGLHADYTVDSYRDFCRHSSGLGVLNIAQLIHGGGRADESDNRLAPSRMTNSKGKIIGREMSVREIKTAIDAFIKAAARAQKAGFQGVELHGAHGYLIHQFLSADTNQRHDDWGGNSLKRTAFLREIAKGVREKCGSDFTIGVRLSPEDKHWFHGIDFDESLELSQQLAEEYAIDYLHVSLWDALKAADKYPDKDPAIKLFRNYIPSEVPLMTAGKIWTAQDAEQVIKAGADMIALGRVAIAHPNWAKEAKNVNFAPKTPPFSTKYLQKAGLSPVFVDYMKRWKGFVGEANLK